MVDVRARRARSGVTSPAASSAILHLRHVDLRSEEHTSELQSQSNLVCRLLLEKKKNTQQTVTHSPTNRTSLRRKPVSDLSLTARYYSPILSATTLTARLLHQHIYTTVLSTLAP